MKFLLPLIMFSGLPMGILLAHIAKPELRQGRRYIGLFRKLLLFSIAGLALLSASIYAGKIVAVAGAAAGVICVLLLERLKPRIDYLLLGIMAAVALSISEDWFLLLFSSLIFMYGLPYGSRLYERKFRWKPVLYHALMFFLPMALFLLGKWGALPMAAAAVCLAFRA